MLWPGVHGRHMVGEHVHPTVCKVRSGCTTQISSTPAQSSEAGTGLMSVVASRDSDNPPSEI